MERNGDNMKAIILAAGQGTRLKKYTENLPKGMLEFAGKTLIERQIETYRKCGITDIIIVRGFAAAKITYQDVKYYENTDYADTNMVVSLMTARQEFKDDIIVSYSDILFEEQMLKGMMVSAADFAVAVDDNWKEYWKARYGGVDFDTESLSLDENDNITELGLEAPRLEDIDARYIGLLKFSRNGLEKITAIFDRDYEEYRDKPWKQSGKTLRRAYMTDLLQAVIESGNPVRAVKFKNGWIEFDTNEDYETAMKWEETGMLDEFIQLQI